MKEFKFEAHQDVLPSRLDKLVANLSSMSRSKIQVIIKSGNLSLGGIKLTDPSIIITKPAKIHFFYEEEINSALLAKKMDLNIIYEDEDIIVLNKPAGLTVHPGAGNYQDTLVNGLLYHSKKLSGLNLDEDNFEATADNERTITGAEKTAALTNRPGIVHRIDRDTTGLLVIAKNNDAHVNLANQIKEKKAQRSYLAIVWGMPKTINGTINTQIGRSNSDKTKMCVLAHGGKHAITYYKVLEVLCNGLFSLVECCLETGRTHQIRVHMSHIGHSIVGDQAYGSNARKVKQVLDEFLRKHLENFNRQALHAYKLGIYHPANDEKMEFSADMPDDMNNLLSVIRSQGGTRGQT